MQQTYSTQPVQQNPPSQPKVTYAMSKPLMGMMITQLILALLILSLGIAASVIVVKNFKEYEGKPHAAGGCAIATGVIGLVGAGLGVGGFFKDYQALIVAQLVINIIAVISDIAQLAVGGEFLARFGPSVDSYDKWPPIFKHLFHITWVTIVFAVFHGLIALISLCMTCCNWCTGRNQNTSPQVVIVQNQLPPQQMMQSPPQHQLPAYQYSPQQAPVNSSYPNLATQEQAMSQFQGSQTAVPTCPTSTVTVLHDHH